jgi:hypothetical protein
MRAFVMNPWTVGLGTGFVLLILSWLGSLYFIPNMNDANTAAIVPLATSTQNLNDMFKKKETYTTTLDKQTFIQNYTNTLINASGTFDDINKSSGGYIVQITVENNAVGCKFGEEYAKELLLLRKRQAVNFSGVFTGGGLGGYGPVNPWYITGCMLNK